MAAIFSKKEEKPKMKDIEGMTTEDIERYLEERKAKAPSEQSVKDKVDESVAMQEKESGTEDSQTAKERVDEAEGEDKALKEAVQPEGKAPEEKAPEETPGEKTEPVQEPNEGKDIALAEKGVDLAEQIRDVLKALSEVEYDEMFAGAHRRHIDKYVGEHKNDRPMPAVAKEKERPKVTLL